MTRPVPRETVRKVRKLAQLAADLPRTPWAISITRLTILKGLCQEPAVAHGFVTYLAGKTLKHVRRGQGRSAHPKVPEQRLHRRMMTEALVEMEAWLQEPTEERRQRLHDLLARVRDQQNEYRNIKWGAVRIIHDWDLLLFEYALHGLLSSPDEAGHWVYQVARHYAERYDSRHGTGLTPKSAPLVQDIVNFWTTVLDIDLSAAPAPAGPTTKTRQAESQPPSDTSAARATTHEKKVRARKFTHRQGQFLAFIHLYCQLHRQGPAELDMVRYFRVTPPSVHDMVVRLEELGLVTRERGVARSVRVAIPEEELPKLEEVNNPS